MVEEIKEMFSSKIARIEEMEAELKTLRAAVQDEKRQGKK
jgi:hypothetical protein